MKRAQCISCKCGSVIAACTEPECYSSKEWMKEVRDYAKKGYSIDLKELPVFKLERCQCAKIDNSTVLTLF